MQIKCKNPHGQINTPDTVQKGMAFCQSNCSLNDYEEVKIHQHGYYYD